MKSLNSLDHLSGSVSFGGGLIQLGSEENRQCLLGIIKMALIGWIFEYGGFPSAISMQVIPKDHKSAWKC